MFDFLWIVCTGQINQVSSIFRNGTVITQLLYLGNIVFHPHKFHVAILDLSCPIPDIHDQEHNTTNQQRDETTVNKFIHERHEISYFYHEITDQEKIDERGSHTMQDQVICKENGGG